MDLIENGTNAHDFTVSEISGALKRSIEDQFGRVRVRGEIGRVSRPSSGHLYFDLKDDRAVLAAVSWKGQVARLGHPPAEGDEVIATGRLTTFPGQSRYQMVVEAIEPAGQGALMAMLERRRKALAAEGLFDAARKRPLPFVPRVIGVVTSPSGAVIRDILHRLRDRFPAHVIVWPVAVQGEACAPQVAAAINGFNALAPGGPVPRPDLLIVARGGGSLEDLWGFNDESVVRAAAASTIPLISAVGHETDTTLIDHAADQRAPTPTAAAEMAVPVRRDLAARLAEASARMARATDARITRPRQRLHDLARAMGRPASLTDPARQRLDLWADRLVPALQNLTRHRRQALMARPMPDASLRAYMATRRHALDRATPRIDMLRGLIATRRHGVERLAARLTGLRGAMAPRWHGLDRLATRLDTLRHGATQRRRDRIEGLGQRLTAARARIIGQTRRDLARQQAQLGGLSARLDTAARRGLATRGEALARLDRLRQTLGHEATLRRGFAVVRDADGGVITRAAPAAAAARLTLQFADGAVQVAPAPKPRKPRAAKKPAQKSLF